MKFAAAIRVNLRRCITARRSQNGMLSTSYAYDVNTHLDYLRVTASGRICMYRKRINLSHVLAGQRMGIKDVDEGIWLISFMHYDLWYIDLEQQTLQGSKYPTPDSVLIPNRHVPPRNRTVML